MDYIPDPCFYIASITASEKICGEENRAKGALTAHRKAVELLHAGLHGV